MVETGERILALAMEPPTGIAPLCVSRDAADRARRLLYAERARLRDQGDCPYDSLSLSISHGSSEILYIYPTDEAIGDEGRG